MNSSEQLGFNWAGLLERREVRCGSDAAYVSLMSQEASSETSSQGKGLTWEVQGGRITAARGAAGRHIRRLVQTRFLGEGEGAAVGVPCDLRLAEAGAGWPQRRASGAAGGWTWLGPLGAGPEGVRGPDPAVSLTRAPLGQCVLPQDSEGQGGEHPKKLLGPRLCRTQEIPLD